MLDLAYTFPLFVLGWIDLVLILAAMTSFVFPFTCGSRWYPNEPAPRIVQYGFPASIRLPFVMFVNNTVIHPQWYVSSISEYGGARGTTAGKFLALSTTCAACFQFMLALCIYQYGAYEYLTRFILLTLGAASCLLIGLDESALPWKEGRTQQIRLLWSVMGNLNRTSQLQNALKVLIQMKTALMGMQQRRPLTQPDLIVHPYWETLLQQKQETLYTTHVLADGARLPSSHVTVPDTTSFVVACREDLVSSLPTTSSISDALKGVLTLQEIESFIQELEQILAPWPKSLESSDVKGHASTELSDVPLKEISATMPNNPPQAYIALTLFETDVADVMVSGASGTSPELILQTDDKEKGVFATIHMCSAMGLIFCNFAAHVISMDELKVNPARYGSFVAAIIGLTAFVVFCIMQYLSGNYEESLGFLPSWMIPSDKWCLKRLYCPQTEPSKYGKCSKKSLALCFIIIESIAFLSIVVSTPIEAILLNYYA